MLLPVRMAVLNQLNRVESSSIAEIMVALEPQYGKEKHHKFKDYLEHMMALEANHYAELHDYKINEKNEIILYYGITEEGKVAVSKYF